MSHDTAMAIGQLRSLTGKFDIAAKDAAKALVYPTLCTQVVSNGADEEYGMLGAVPGVREWLGDRDFKELRAAKFTIVNKTFESSILISRENIADDRMGLYGPVFQAMGTRAALHPDTLLFNLIEAASSTVCLDGQYLIDDDHSWGDSGTQDNNLTYNASDHTAVTAAEFKLGFNQALNALTNFKDDRGEYLNGPIFDEGSQLVVVLGANYLYQVALDALAVRTVSAGGENFVISRPKIISTARYSSTTAFDLYKVDEPLRPYVFQAREPLRREMKGLDDIEEKGVKFMTEARYNLGPGAWWAAVRTTFN